MLLRPWTRPLPARAARRAGASGASAPSWTSAPGGAESSAKPPPPRTTSGPEVWKAGPSNWARHAASTGFRGSPAERARRAVDTQRAARGLDDGLPARAPAQVGAQAPPRCPRRVGGRAAPVASSAASRSTMPGVQKPHWLAPCCDEGGGPAVAQLRRCSLEGGDVAAGDAADGRHAGDAGCPVDPHGAAAALALRAAAVLDRAAAELVAQRVQQGDPVGDGDRVPVEDEGDGRGRRGRGRTPRGLLGGGPVPLRGRGARRLS